MVPDFVPSSGIEPVLAAPADFFRLRRLMDPVSWEPAGLVPSVRFLRRRFWGAAGSSARRRTVSNAFSAASISVRSRASSSSIGGGFAAGGRGLRGVGTKNRTRNMYGVPSCSPGPAKPPSLPPVVTVFAHLLAPWRVLPAFSGAIAPPRPGAYSFQGRLFPESSTSGRPRTEAITPAVISMGADESTVASTLGPAMTSTRTVTSDTRVLLHR